MKVSGAKVWIYLIGFDMGDLTWMRHSWMPLVYKLKHDFENLDFWGKDDFFYFKMDEAWSNAPSLEMDAWFLKILIDFFFLEKMMMMIFIFFSLFFFFLKMNEAWPNAPSLQIDAWLLKTLIFEEKMISFFQNGWGMAECA